MYVLSGDTVSTKTNILTSIKNSMKKETNQFA